MPAARLVRARCGRSPKSDDTQTRLTPLGVWPFGPSPITRTSTVKTLAHCRHADGRRALSVGGARGQCSAAAHEHTVSTPPDTASQSSLAQRQAATCRTNAANSTDDSPPTNRWSLLHPMTAIIVRSENEPVNLRFPTVCSKAKTKTSKTRN